MDLTLVTEPALWTPIGDWRLTCAFGFGLGALGGFIQAIGASPAIAPKEWWKRVVIGAVAAVAILYVNEPATAIELISGSLVAGFAGQALLTALEARVRLEAAEQKVDETQRALAAKVDEVDETKDALHARGEEVRLAARERDTAIEAANLLLGEPGLPTAAEATRPVIARIEAARGMLSAIRRPGSAL